MIAKYFHKIRKNDNLIIELNILVRNTIVFFSRCLIISAVIKSKPGDFHEIFFMINSTSLGEKGREGREICRGEPRTFSTSLIIFGDRILWCDWKVLAKCFANIFAWSCWDVAWMSFLLRKVDGGLWIRRSFLIAFYRVPYLWESDDRGAVYDSDLWLTNRRLSITQKHCNGAYLKVSDVFPDSSSALVRLKSLYE